MKSVTCTAEITERVLYQPALSLMKCLSSGVRNIWRGQIIWNSHSHIAGLIGDCSTSIRFHVLPVTGKCNNTFNAHVQSIYSSVPITEVLREQNEMRGELLSMKKLKGLVQWCWWWPNFKTISMISTQKLRKTGWTWGQSESWIPEPCTSRLQ